MSKKGKPILKTLTKGQEKGRLVLDKASIFLERKKALMIRDPQVQNYLEELSIYDLKKDRPKKDNLEKRRQVLETKWNVNISNSKFTLPSSPIKVFQKVPISSGDLVISNRIQGYPISSLPINYLATMEWLKDSENMVFVQIDLSLIKRSSNSERLVKNATWLIVKEHLKKKTSIPREPQEVKVLYRFRRQDTFDNYLRWYDTHVKERLGFRLIAFLERIRGENITAYERWLETLRTRKWKVHHPEKGEDRVENGVKLIWKAIHREPYTQRKIEPLIEEWSCPEHAKEYHPTCKDCEALNGRFNRIYPMEKGYIRTISDDNMDLLYYERMGRFFKRRRSSNPDDI